MSLEVLGSFGLLKVVKFNFVIFVTIVDYTWSNCLEQENSFERVSRFITSVQYIIRSFWLSYIQNFAILGHLQKRVYLVEILKAQTFHNVYQVKINWVIMLTKKLSVETINWNETCSYLHHALYFINLNFASTYFSVKFKPNDLLLFHYANYSCYNL